jgi:hypothetical protein
VPSLKNLRKLRIFYILPLKDAKQSVEAFQAAGHDHTVIVFDIEGEDMGDDLEDKEDAVY